MPVRLLTLLSLDGDPHVRVVAAKGITVPELAGGLERGEVRPGISPEALLAAFNALSFGYCIFRERYTAELQVPLGRLGAEVEEAFKRMVFT